MHSRNFKNFFKMVNRLELYALSCNLVAHKELYKATTLPCKALPGPWGAILGSLSCPRTLRHVTPITNPLIIGGPALLNFSNNDYGGYSQTHKDCDSSYCKLL